MPSRKRSRLTLRERGMKPPHSCRDSLGCGLCEEQRWEDLKRTHWIHNIATFDRYIIEEVPF